MSLTKEEKNNIFIKLYLKKGGGNLYQLSIQISATNLKIIHI